VYERRGGTRPYRGLADDVLGFAGQKGFYIGDSNVEQPRTRSAGRPGDVRGDEAVFGAQERMIRGRRLDGEHVEARPGNALGMQSFNQSGLIDQGPAAGVEEKSGSLNPAETLGVDEVFRLRSQWAMQADDIALA